MSFKIVVQSYERAEFASDVFFFCEAEKNNGDDGGGAPETEGKKGKNGKKQTARIF